VLYLHHKKSFSIFLSPAEMSLTKLSLGGNNLYMTSLFPLRESLVSDIPAGDGNIEKLFYGVSCPRHLAMAHMGKKWRRTIFAKKRLYTFSKSLNIFFFLHTGIRICVQKDLI
jgi:hypothetical protein